jgi:hypothetical protein
MPKNCSKDVSLVIDYMDKILMGKNETAKYELKKMFGLEALEHNDDFMGYVLNRHNLLHHLTRVVFLKTGRGFGNPTAFTPTTPDSINFVMLSRMWKLVRL